MLYQNKTLNETKFNKFYKNNDLEIGLIGHIDRNIAVTDITNLLDFVREADGDFLILAKQDSRLVIITHPLMTKTCYYKLDDVTVSLTPEGENPINWTVCLPNTLYTFDNGELVSMSSCVKWDRREFRNDYDLVFDSFEQGMKTVPKNNTTLSSGKDTGVICAYLNRDKLQCVYHTISQSVEHQDILKQRIAKIKSSNGNSRLMIEKNQDITDGLIKRVSKQGSICYPRVLSDLQTMADLDKMLSKVIIGSDILIGTGGDQLYRFKSTVTNPTDLFIDQLNMVSSWHNITHLNPLMSVKLYQSFLNVNDTFKKTHCWQEAYMHELGYPYAVDKYHKL